MAFSTHDIVPDSPTNNFATLNPLKGNGAPSDGNLKFVPSDAHSAAGTTMHIDSGSGKWYIEYYGTGWDNPPILVFHTPETTTPDIYTNTSTTNVWSWRSNGDWTTTGMATQNTGLPTWSSGNIVGVLIDYDNDGIFAFVNGSAVNSGNKLFSPSILDKKFGLTVKAYNGTHYMNYGQDPTFAGSKSPSTTYTDANGIGAFYYQPPTGALALCTANLPDFTPTITGDVPQDYFKAVLYPGNGTSQSITGVGFQPDLVWSKPRSSGFNIIRDSVRGSTYRLITDDTYAELSDSNYGTFSSTGFNLGSEGNVNSNNINYIAWCWKAGGNSNTFNINGTGYSTYSALQTANTSLPASSTSGMIEPSGMSINTDAGFSIVKYPADGNNGAKIPHGLNSAPEMIIIKGLDNSDFQWETQHIDISLTGAGIHLNNNTTYNSSASDRWNQQRANSTVVTVSNNGAVNNVGEDFIMYCWHSVEGYSKFGSYTGNGSTDGPFVYTGFRPAFVMIKCLSDTTTTHTSWAMYDNARDSSNVMNKVLYANESINEGYRGDASTAATDIYIDFLSNGFKVRSTKEEINDDGETYIFMAFAEQPFKFNNAR